MTTPTNGPDVLSGTGASDTISGLGGNDLISGLGGADVLGGNAGNDILNGGRGDDVLNGGADFDVANFNDGAFAVEADLMSGTAIVEVNGTSEHDTLISIEGLTGGDGDDLLSG